MVGDALGEASLVAAALAGNAGAFASLYRAHVGAVTHVVWSNVRDKDSIPDVVQEVFTRALAQLPSLRDQDHFRPWLLTIARNIAIDTRRSAARSPKALSLNDPEALVEPLSADPGAEDLAAARELAQLVEGCVAGLSSRDATALSLVSHLGFSPSEVASVLGVTAGTARVIVHRARNRLRQALALEMLVRRPGGCEQFEALLVIGSPLASARHVRSCPACKCRMESEIQGHEG
jgi:RNA polymerase sigma factor (sigma-70 family)